MAGGVQAGDDFGPDIACGERPGEPGPPEGNDAFGECEARTEAAEVFVALLYRRDGADHADQRAFGFGRSQVKKQPLSYGNETKDDHVRRTDGRGDVVSVNRIVVVHR